MNIRSLMTLVLVASVAWLVFSVLGSGRVPWETAVSVLAMLAAGVSTVVLVQSARRNSRRSVRAEPRANHLELLEPSVPVAGEIDAKLRRISAHSESGYIPLRVYGEHDAERNQQTYLAAYGLMVQGVDVYLDMLEIFDEGLVAVRGRPMRHVASRIRYTAEKLVPHLGSIHSLADFKRYVPYREGRTMALFVHPLDLVTAYTSLRELKVRLSPLYHPDQAWWLEEPGEND